MSVENQVQVCSRCCKTVLNSSYKTCDDCRSYFRQIRQKQAAVRKENEADEGRKRGRKKQLPAAYISQLHRMKPLEIGKMDKICQHCKAKHWLAELPFASKKGEEVWMSCYRGGRVKIDFIKRPFDYLQYLLTDTEDEGTEFRENIRQYNSALAFTSIRCEQVQLGNTNGGSNYFTPFQNQGCLYHTQGSLMNESVSDSRYAQLYIYDPLFAGQLRKCQNNNLSKSILKKLSTFIHECSPYVVMYKSAYELLIEADLDECAVFVSDTGTLQLVAGLDRRTENLPSSDEVAAIVPNSNEYKGNERDIRIFLRETGGFTRISQNYALYMPLHYVLLFPMGDSGWNWNLRTETVEGKEMRLSQRAYYRFRLHIRPTETEFPTLFLSQRLFQHYVVDAWAICDQNKLDWIKQHQDEIRVDYYKNVEDALIREDTDNMLLVVE